MRAGSSLLLYPFRVQGSLCPGAGPVTNRSQFIFDGEVHAGLRCPASVSRVELVGQPLILLAHVAENERPGLGPAEVELDVVLQGESVSAVELQALTACAERGLSGEDERHRGQPSGVGVVG